MDMRCRQRTSGTGPDERLIDDTPPDETKMRYVWGMARHSRLVCDRPARDLRERQPSVSGELSPTRPQFVHRSRSSVVALATLLALTLGCGDDGDTAAPTAPEAPPSTPSTQNQPSAPSGTSFFTQDGQLQEGPNTRASYEIQVGAGEHVVVQLTSSAFDPVLEVTPPGGGALTNDDYRGSRTTSRVEVWTQEAGTMKVEVRAFAGSGAGAFHVEASRQTGAADGSGAVFTLAPGASHDGQLNTSDAQLGDGRYHERVLVPGPAMGTEELRIEAAGQAVPLAIVTGPDGRSVPSSGPGTYRLVLPGIHQVQMVSAQPNQEAAYRMSLSAQPTLAAAATAAIGVTTMGASEGAQAAQNAAQQLANQATAQVGVLPPQLSRQHHQLPPATTPAQAITLGQQLSANLAAGDPTLPTGEATDVYTVELQQGEEIRLEMRAANQGFDPYLMVVGPTGRYWENDDSGGTLDSALGLSVPESGTYRVVASTYRAGMYGDYTLKLDRPQAVVAAATSASPDDRRTVSGALAQGDQQLQSGEFMDAHEVQLAAGQSLRLEATSTEFDTYLILQPPGGGQQMDNDDYDPDQGTNSRIDYVASTAGTHRVLVTSYQPGETGNYQLVIQSGSSGAAPPAVAGNTAPTPTPSATGGDTIRGSLAAGDAQLQSGEYNDPYERSFPAGQPVSIRMNSTELDPYLIVIPPGGGQQQDNDDYTPGQLNAGVDIPAAQAGNYRILATTYRPGETGNYELSFSVGGIAPPPAVANNTPTPNNGTPNNGTPSAAPAGGPRVFGLFVGISDYPGTANDLPECANDATKLAEALRNRGLADPAHQMVLTDSQANRQNVRAALERFATQMTPQDVFVFFFSGHGGQTRSSSDPRELDGVDEYIVLHDGNLMDNDLGQLFDRLQAGVSVASIDACHSGGFAKDLVTRPGVVGYFSSEEDVLSAVASQFQAGGYLSHFLQEGLRGAADAAPRDGVLTIGELSHHLYSQFGQHATDVRLQGAYQHLVIDRGAVRNDQVLWRYRN